VNRHSFLFTDGAALVDGSAQYVHDAAEGFDTHRHRYRRAGVLYIQTPAETFSGPQRNGAYHTVTQLLLNFQGYLSIIDSQRIIYLGYTLA